MSAALTCEGLVAGYKSLAVVRDFDLEVQPGEVVALLGPNGAGKTTILMTLAGFLAPLGGRVLRNGTPVTRSDPERTVRDGTLLVPDDRALFPSLTVREHLSLARGRKGLSEAEVLAYFPQLEDRITTAAGSLSGGEQQMLALARALAQRPTVMLIDELSMGLAPIIVERLLPVLRQVAETGTSVLVVEQHVQLALRHADRALVLVHGRTALEGPAQELLDDPMRLEEAYLTGSTTSA